MTNQRRPLTGSDAAGAGARLPAANPIFIDFLAGIASVAKRFRHVT
jgi:hypothetical protein